MKKWENTLTNILTKLHWRTANSEKYEWIAVRSLFIGQTLSEKSQTDAPCLRNPETHVLGSVLSRPTPTFYGY